MNTFKNRSPDRSAPAPANISNQCVPDGLGGLTIGEIFAELHERDERQPPRGQPGVAPRRKQRGEVFILKNGAQLIPQGQIGIADTVGELQSMVFQ